MYNNLTKVIIARVIGYVWAAVALCVALLPLKAHAMNYCSSYSIPSNVTLNSYATSAFSGAGSMRLAAIGVQISGSCIGNIPFFSYIYLQESGGSFVDPLTNNLTNSIAPASGGAGNIQIRIESVDNGKQILLSKGIGQQQEFHSPNQFPTFQYQIYYYATGAVTAGTVKAVVAFTIEYP